MNAGRQLLRLSATAAPKQGSRSYVSLERIKELQKQYQKDDGLPVHLKNGTSDLILYRLACWGTAALTATTFYRLWKLTFKGHL